MSSNHIATSPLGDNDHPWYGALEFRTLAETVPALLFVINRNGKAIYTNASFHRYTGMPHERVDGLGYLDVLHPEDQTRALQLWDQVAYTTEAYEVEYRIRRHDGIYRWHQVRGAPVLDANGNAVRWISVCTDIQELRTAVNAAADAHELIAVLGRSTDAIVFAKDAEGRFVFANEATLRVMEISADRLIGASVEDAANSQSDAQHIGVNDATVMANRQMIVAEERWTTKSGVEQVFRSTKGPWLRADGSVGVVGITTDITHERELEDLTREQQHDFRNLIENLPFVLWITDASGRLIIRNNLWQAHTGLPDSDAHPLTFADLVDPLDLSKFKDAWRSCIERQEIFNQIVRLRNVGGSSSVAHRIVSIPVKNRNGTING